MNFFRDNRNTVLLILVSVILVAAMIAYSSGKPNAGIVNDTVGVVLKPFQSVGAYVGNCFRYASNADKFENENSLLKQQLIVMTQRAGNYEELKEENERLRAMLELQKNSADFTLKAASVIAADTENWSSTLKLDKGLSDGIKKNDAVMTETGLVGYVSEVGRNWAKVVTIIDNTSSVSAMIDRIGEYCMVQGDISLFDDGFCAMKYVTTESAISVGDILVTSGEGGVYPGGIRIGKINEIISNTNGLSLDAVIEPSVDFSELNEVFVVIDKK